MKKYKYDERQLMIQNSIYKYMFIGLAILELLNVCLNYYGIKWAVSGLFSFCIITIIVATPGVYIMVFKEAYMTSFKSKVIFSIFFGISEILLLVETIYRLLSGCEVCEKIIINGSLTATGCLLICTILFFIFALSGVLKILYDKFNKNEKIIEKE